MPPVFHASQIGTTRLAAFLLGTLQKCWLKLLGSSLSSNIPAKKDSKSVRKSVQTKSSPLMTSLLNEIREQCPDFRAIHVIREVISTTISGVIYHQKIKGELVKNHAKILLNAANVSENIRLEIGIQSNTTLPQMASVYKSVKC